MCKPFSLWASLKGLIGKDIMDATLPIGQHCPLTELQFRGDELECTRLLDEVTKRGISMSMRPGCWVACQSFAGTQIAANNPASGFRARLQVALYMPDCLWLQVHQHVRLSPRCSDRHCSQEDCHLITSVRLQMVL